MSYKKQPSVVRQLTPSSRLKYDLLSPTGQSDLLGNFINLRRQSILSDSVSGELSFTPFMETRSRKRTPVKGSSPGISPMKQARALNAKQLAIAELQDKLTRNMTRGGTPQEKKNAEAQLGKSIEKHGDLRSPEQKGGYFTELDRQARSEQKKRRQTMSEPASESKRSRISEAAGPAPVDEEGRSLLQAFREASQDIDRTSTEVDAVTEAEMTAVRAIQNVTGSVQADIMDTMRTFEEQAAHERAVALAQINETSQVDPTQARLNANASIITPAVLAAGDNNAVTEQRSDVPVIDHKSVTANPYAMAFQDVGTVYGTNMSNSTVESRVNARMKALPTDSLWWLKDPLKMKEDSVDAQLARAAVAYQAKNPQFEKKNEQEVERLLSRTPVYRVYASDCAQSVSSVPSMVKLF